jgi:nucleotide sugar dehydrogenase
MKKLNILVAGYGFVGSALVSGFSGNNIYIADPKLGTSVDDFLSKELDVVFICAPTPMGKDGAIDISIVQSIVSKVSVLTVPIVLKSTVTPELVEQFSDQYVNFVYNPEFLTERNAAHEFEYPIMQVFGGTRQNTDKLEEIYKSSICKECPVYHMSAKEASFVKYGMNSFLATKVLFWNQFSDICEKVGADYSVIKTAIGTDSRIGSSHMNVPGNDGRKGFGSACFSKDVPAFIRYAKKVKADFTVLNEAWHANCDYRNVYPNLLEREISQHISFDKI